MGVLTLETAKIEHHRKKAASRLGNINADHEVFPGKGMPAEAKSLLEKRYRQKVAWHTRFLVLFKEWARALEKD